MSLWLAAILVAAGLLLLFWGGELLVKGSVSIARRLNLSELFIGIVLVGFGTSLPETLTVFAAAQAGDNGLGLGNIVGSNIANIGLILGLALLFANAKHLLKVPAERINFVLMLVGLVAFTVLIQLIPSLTWLWGLGLTALLIVLLAISWKTGTPPTVEEDEAGLKPLLATVAALGGLILLVLGAKALVSGATTLAVAMGVSELVIGLTLVAVGTSLPELAATIAAARHGKLTLIVGNVLGSNLFNVLAAAGLGALGGSLATTGLGFSLLVMWVLTALMAVIFWPRWQKPRLLGAILLASYVAYITSLALTGQAG